MSSLSKSLTIPDLWQQEAVRALRAGRDVVVQAPTGAGKTWVFELFLPEVRGQAVFTVPTRALANDKLAEWRQRGWDAGISTGDLAHRLEAPLLVATLETQKGKFLQRLGPRLFVVDEYQMIGDPVRGVNYELALALAPPETQLLLLSGSVGNPQDVVAWLRRIGRDAVLISHHERPVPLTEVDLEGLPGRPGKEARGWWPPLVVNALRADLGPILLFAPRRKAAEDLALQLAAALPGDRPLALTLEQEQLAGPRLTRMLRARVAYHHSGLSYALRAGLIEPLAKAGQLRAVVATMGLAAGINFSMRSVLVTDTRYVAGPFEKQVSPDELLQMFGRAGRRGLDEAGFALFGEGSPRLHDARPRQLRRPAVIDWPTLLAVMQGAVQQGREPFAAALELNSRLFTTQPIPLGIEHSRATGPMPCGLAVDMERARFARRGAAEMINSRGAWEALGETVESTLGEAWILEGAHWRPALSLARTLEGRGQGNLCKLGHGAGKRYGREVPLGTRQPDGSIQLAPWLKRALRRPRLPAEQLPSAVLTRLPQLTGGTLAEVVERGPQLAARLSYAEIPVTARRDSAGAALLDPPERRALPPPCRGCPELERYCQAVEIVQTPAHAWRRLGLVERDGRPTRRGVIFSFFHYGEGLAVAAALEDQSYLIEELIFDLANLRAGPRFAGEDSPLGGRLGALCQRVYERADLPGYLSMGVPLTYGSGAAEVIREMVEQGAARHKLLTESLRPGDLERALVEWRSLLRHIVWAPAHPWERWQALQSAAARQIEASQSPAALPAPPLLSRAG